MVLLSVLRKKAEQTDDAVEVMRAALEGAKTALAKTPDMLPVLKEVGVVDSGGQGLVFICLLSFFLSTDSSTTKKLSKSFLQLVS